MLNKFKKIWPFFLSAVFGFLIASFIFFPKAYSSNQSIYKTLQNKLRDLNQILGYLNHFYFDDVDMDKIMDGAFFGLMEELDPHSTYIPAKEQENIDEMFKGKFQGIGIEFDILDGFITVISPVPDSPSDIVGLMPGDKIISINGVDAYKITKEEVFKKLRGKKNTKVTVKISRIGVKKPFDVTIIRDDIPIYSVGAATMINQKTGYIFLRRFSATTKDEVTKSINKLLNKGMTQLIFDLRGNSGGYLEQAAAIVDQFITTEDTLVYTLGKIKESNQVFKGSSKIGNDTFSLIIMINRGSASAAEIVSGAIQDLDRGIVVGETSFGKGLVQRQLPLESGAAVRVTIARYYTPSGRLIQRPYNNGDELAYYKELYAENRESIIDSLKELRPKYNTKSGRIVYGGGGITPDIYIPYKSNLNKETSKVLRSPKRPFFNFASEYANQNRKEFNSFKNFKNEWIIPKNLFENFITHLENDSIFISQDSLKVDSVFIHNRIKSEIAEAIWGKDEGANIRLKLDNQVNEALKHFNEANTFLKSLN